MSTQRQPYVMVAGPGAQVSSLGKDGRLYHYGNGTSQATAIVSGTVALIRARYPEEPAKRIVQRIINTTTDVGPPGKDDQLGYGGVSLRKAMTTQVPMDAPNPVYARLDKALADNAAAKANEEKEDRAREAGTPRKKSLLAPSPFLLVGGVIVMVVLLLVVVVAVLITRRRKGATGQALRMTHLGS
jgi:hypothetical protein